MEAFSASIILFLGRAWDGITDPLIGYAVSKSGRTRIGKLIPWWVCVAVNIRLLPKIRPEFTNIYTTYFEHIYDSGLCALFTQDCFHNATWGPIVCHALVYPTGHHVLFLQFQLVLHMVLSVWHPHECKHTTTIICPQFSVILHIQC